MRRLLPAFAGLFLFAAACSDDATSVVAPPGGASQAVAPCCRGGAAAGPGQYWRDPHQLWVYDTEPELGFHTFFGEPERVALIRDAGMRVVRMDLPWDATTEDAPYHYAPKLYEFSAAVQSAVDAGLTPLVVVHWYHGQPSPPGLAGPNVDLAEFNRRYAAFLAEAARSFPGVKFWQIWNEPDGGYWGQHWAGWDNSTQQFPRREQGRRYAATLRAVYPAIKAANPNAWVVTAGLTGTERMDPVPGGHVINPATSWEFLNGMYDNGAEPYFDILAVHSYGASPSGGTPQDGTLDTDGASIMQVVRAREGRSGRPLWLTETGKAGTDAQQQAWWQGALDVIGALNSPYSKVLGFSLRSPVDGTGFDDGVGWFRTDWSARPVYSYVQSRNFNAAILNAPVVDRTVTTYSPDEGPVGYAYSRSGDSVTFTVRVDRMVPTAVEFAPIVHRLFSHTLLDHMYGDDPNEAPGAGYVLEGRNYFRLLSQPNIATSPLYRCFVNSHHYLSDDEYCEVGVPAESTLGHFAWWQQAGTVPLYRFRSTYNGDRVSTTDPVEAQTVRNTGNYVDEGITGYVWPVPSTP